MDASCSELSLHGVHLIAHGVMVCIVLQSVPPKMRYGAAPQSGNTFATVSAKYL